MSATPVVVELTHHELKIHPSIQGDERFVNSSGLRTIKTLYDSMIAYKRKCELNASRPRNPGEPSPVSSDTFGFDPVLFMQLVRTAKSSELSNFVHTATSIEARVDKVNADEFLCHVEFRTIQEIVNMKPTANFMRFRVMILTGSIADVTYSTELNIL